MEGIYLLCLLLCLIVSPAVGYSLEGRWTLKEVDGSEVSVEVSIEQFVFRKESIRHRVSFQTCQPIKYMASVEENNIYFDIDSEFIDQTGECSQQGTKIARAVRIALRRVLKFDIDGPSLTLIDVFRGKAASLNRRISPQIVRSRTNITGSWIVSFTSASRSTHVLLVDDTFIQVCGATFAYNLQDNFKASTQNIVTGSCRDSQVVADFGRVAYYRKFGERIQFYDRNINLLLSGSVDPNAERRPPPVPEVIQIPQVEGIRPGRYILLLLFRRDLPRARVEFTDTQLKIKLCTELVFNYQATVQGSLQLTSSSVPDTNCRRADESIYLNTILSAVSYSKQQDGDLTLLNKQGRQVISLAA